VTLCFYEADLQDQKDPVGRPHGKELTINLLDHGGPIDSTLAKDDNSEGALQRTLDQLIANQIGPDRPRVVDRTSVSGFPVDIAAGPASARPSVQLFIAVNNHQVVELISSDLPAGDLQKLAEQVVTK
jgi:hypothetical protein